jgi:hypothetical protein
MIGGFGNRALRDRSESFRAALPRVWPELQVAIPWALRRERAAEAFHSRLTLPGR